MPSGTLRLDTAERGSDAYGKKALVAIPRRGSHDKWKPYIMSYIPNTHRHSPRHFISNPEMANTGRHPPLLISRHIFIINNINLPIIWIHHKVFLNTALQEAIMNQSLRNNRLNETHLPSLININNINKEHFAVQ